MGWAAGPSPFVFALHSCEPHVASERETTARDPPTCKYRDPITQDVCAAEALMPPFRADDLGPACARSTFKVNEDQRELRAHVPDGWRVSEPGAATPSFRPVRDGVIVPWDPVAGIDVEDFLEALRSSFHPKGTAGAPHSCAAGGTPRARGRRRGSGRHPGRRLLRPNGEHGVPDRGGGERRTGSRHRPRCRARPRLRPRLS
jgi:hypothetical protein